MLSSLKMNPLLILIIITMITPTIKASKDFNVGDDSGWQVPQKNNSNMYLKWADKNTFHVGDSLVFKYQNNSVVMVDKRGYYHCNHSSHDRVFDDGNTVFVLNKPGFYYFESGDFQHCKNGQRLMINANDSNLKVSGFGVSSGSTPFLVLIVFISTLTGLDLIHDMIH